MKLLNFALLALLSQLPVSAQAAMEYQTLIVKGREAKDLIQALVAAGYKDDSQGDLQPVTVQAGAIDCRFNDRAIDGLISWPSCGSVGEDKFLEDKDGPTNPLALVKALLAAGAYNAQDMGHNTVTAETIKCVMKYANSPMHETSVRCVLKTRKLD